MLQVDREDEALGVWLYGKLTKFGESADKLANRGTAPNLSVVVSTLLTLVLLNRKIAESTFHLLHERKRMWLATLLLSMVCYALPDMNSMSLFLFAVSVAAVFYPSERVLLLKSHPEAINNPKDLLALSLRNYY